MFVSNLDEVRNEFVQRVLGIKMVYRFLIAPNTDHILAIKRVVSSPNADNMPALPASTVHPEVVSDIAGLPAQEGGW